MKNLSRLAVMTICLLLTAIFTSACGGSSSNTPPSDNSALYFLLAQQNNNNNQQNNNNNEGQNNEEEPVANTEVTLTLIDSLQSDKVATADIYYSTEDNTKSSADDQEILKAEPNADDKTKFTIKVNENVKIKAVLTYDNEGNLLDYFSSYNGIEATNSNFNIDFENSKDNEEGFADGTGTERDPFIISAPRHFVNINKKDAQGDYLYLGKENTYFQQTEDLDFTHLTGLKIVNADDDKDITIEENNKKAPFYNEGHGITPIAEAINNEKAIELKGSYDGTDHIIDGIYLVNPQQNTIGLFTRLTDGNIKNLTIGKNSIIFIDQNNENYSNNTIELSGLVGFSKNSTFENCTNNAKIIVKNIEAKYIMICGLANSTSDCELKKCTSNGNILLDNCNISNYCNIYGINSMSNNCDNCTNKRKITINNCNISYGNFYGGCNFNSNNYENCINEGYIKVTNNDLKSLCIAGCTYSTQNITNCKNTGNIEVTGNKINNLQVSGIAISFKNGTNCTNDGHISITNNKPLSSSSWIYIAGIVDTVSSTMTGCINNGYITYNENTLNASFKIINGLNGQMNYDGTITDCVNNGTITIDGVVQQEQ